MTKNPFWSSHTYTIIKAMKMCGNSQGIVSQWIEKAGRWAANNTGPDADALKTWLPLWRARPFYTAAELAPMLPALAIGLNLTSRWQAPKHPTRLRNELIMGDLPRLQNADGTLEFIQDGKFQEFFIVDRIGYWKKQTLTQEEFENVVFN